MKEDIVTGEVDLLAIFNRDIRRIARLDKEGELKIAKLAEEGDQKATMKLVEASLGYVVKVAFKCWRPGLQLMDLIGEGCLGVMIAAKKYDYKKDASFITYADFWIRQKMYRAINKHNKHCLPSLDEPLSVDSETTAKDMLPDEQESLEKAVYSKQVKQLLSCLKERERKILLLRFWHELTADEVGRMLGISRTRVLDLEARSLMRIRLMNRAGYFAGEEKQNNAL